MGGLAAKKHVDFNPETWQQSIGDLCLSCRSRVNSDQVISLCRCHLFCHQACFLKEFEPELSEKSQYRCIRCEQIIQITIQHQVKYQCIKKPAFIIPIILGIIALVVQAAMTFSGRYQQIMPNQFSYTILAVLLFAFAYSIIKATRKSSIDLKKTKCKDTHMYTKNLKEGTQQKIKDIQDFTDNHIGKFDNIVEGTLQTI